MHVRYLYHNRLVAGPDYPIQRHTHVFWHAEFVKNGTLVSRVGDRELVARQGEAVLLPPNVPHTFVFRDVDTEVFSVKFATEYTGRVGTLKATVGDDAARALELLQALSDHQRTTREHITAALGHAAGAAVTLTFPWILQVHDPSTMAIVDRIEHEVREADGRPMTIGSVAKALGYSAVHVRTVFHNTHGQTLKHFIDLARIQVAIRYLGTTDLRIKEVAAAMGFSSQQSFARFCRRMTGVFPTHIRGQIRKGNEVQAGGVSSDQ